MAGTIYVDTTLTTTKKLLFRDSGLYLQSSVDGQLDIIADVLLQLGATGNLELNDAVNVVLGTTTGTKFGTGTTQKIGFFNAAPIIQQTTTSQTPATFVANTSLTANDTATWDGYTIGDVVKILRVFGFLA